MKRLITTFLTMAMLAVSLPMLAGSASAQRRPSYNQDQYSRDYGYDQRNYEYNDQYEVYREPNVYDKHRKAVNLAVGTGVGALIGAFIGGKKGALIGGAAGLVGGAIVTKKQKPRNPRNIYYY